MCGAMVPSFIIKSLTLFINKILEHRRNNMAFSTHIKLIFIYISRLLRCVTG